MASDLGNSVQQFTLSRGRISAWLILLASIFCFVLYKATDNRHDDAAQRQYDMRLKQLISEREEFLRQMRDRLRPLVGQSESKRQLEVELNDGRPFTTTREGGRDAVHWTDPKFGSYYRLRFEGEVLSGYDANTGSTLQNLNPRPARFSQSNSVEQMRLRFVQFGPWLWSLLMFGSIVAWRPGLALALAEASLAAALACGAAWLVSPNYSLTWQGVFSNDSLFFAGVMILLSVLVLAAVLGSRNAQQGSKWLFRFRTRHLLIVMTIAAVLLTAGPIGWLILIVAFIGLIIFAVAYRVRRLY